MEEVTFRNPAITAGQLEFVLLLNRPPSACAVMVPVGSGGASGCDGSSRRRGSGCHAARGPGGCLERCVPVERSASTYFCVELDRVTVAQLRAVDDGITPSAIDLVREGARIVQKHGAQRLFSFHVEDGISLSTLCDRWSRQRQDLGIDDPATGRWCESCGCREPCHVMRPARTRE